MSQIISKSSRAVHGFACRKQVARMCVRTVVTTAEINKLNSWAATAKSTAEKYANPPSPIDFSGAKSNIRDKQLVDVLESFYSSTTPPPETYEYSTEESSLDDAKIEYAKELFAVNQELLPVLESELDFQMSNRVTMETTLLDMQMNYPLIHEEVEDELERREWFKDSDPTAA